MSTSAADSRQAAMSAKKKLKSPSLRTLRPLGVSARNLARPNFRLAGYLVNAEVQCRSSHPRFPTRTSRRRQRGSGNGVRTSVELNRRKKLRDGIWALKDEDSNVKPKPGGYRDYRDYRDGNPGQ